jgi:hypothetical protein
MMPNAPNTSWAVKCASVAPEAPCNLGPRANQLEYYLVVFTLATAGFSASVKLRAIEAHAVALADIH